MVQLNDPVLGVLAVAVPAKTPALNNSIFTLEPTAPDEVHVIKCVDPGAQTSPPLGLVTVMVDVGGGPEPMVK